MGKQLGSEFGSSGSRAKSIGLQEAKSVQVCCVSQSRELWHLRSNFRDHSYLRQKMFHVHLRLQCSQLYRQHCSWRRLQIPACTRWENSSAACCSTGNMGNIQYSKLWAMRKISSLTKAAKIRWMRIALCLTSNYRHRVAVCLQWWANGREKVDRCKNLELQANS